MENYYSDDRVNIVDVIDSGVEPSDPNNPALVARLKFIQEKVKQHRNDRKILHRQELFKQKEDICVHKENDDALLLQIFPEEVWSIILNHPMLDLKDHKNSANSCALFESILHLSNHLRYFEQILPFVQKYLSTHEVLTCRQICKKWLNGVHTYLESLGRSLLGNVDYHYENYTHDHDKHTKFVYKTKLSQYQEEEEILSIFKEHHIKNPFVSRSVIMNGTRGPPDLDEFLYNFGDYIWHTKLNYGTEDPLPKSASNYYSSFLQILRGCPNLRSVYLYDACYRNTKGLAGDTSLLNVMPPEHAYLNSLVCFANHWHIVPYQDNLLRQYSSQLKYLSVCRWNSILYQSLNWNNLCELSVHHRKHQEEMYESLTQLNAPNLQRFSICVPTKEDKLIMLMRVLYSFPKLSILRLEIGYDLRGFLDSEIINLPNDLACCPGITNLTILVDFGKSALLNFLLCFPLVRKLRVEHSNKNKLHVENTDEENFVDLVQLSHMETKSEEVFPMYKSRIWEIMPRLDILEDVNDINIRIYTRKGYEQKLSWEQKREIILRLAKEETNRQRKLKKQLLKEKLELLRNELANKKADNCSQPGILCHQILYLVVPYLDKQQILKCRTICKAWESAITNCLQGYIEDNKLLNPVSDIYCLFSNQKIDIPYKFSFPLSENQKQKLQEMRLAHTTNPFISKRVDITISKVEDNQQSLEIELLEFFETFGEHIRTMNLSGGNGSFVELNSKRLIQIIVVILKFCKNLEKFSSINISQKWNAEEEEIECEYTDMPPHDNLKRLNLDVYFPSKVRNAFKHIYSKQITSFLDSHLSVDGDASMELWPNLVELKDHYSYITRAELRKRVLYNEEDEDTMLFGDLSKAEEGIQHYRNLIDNIFKTTTLCLKTLRIIVDGGENEILSLILLTRRLPTLTTLALELWSEPINSSAEEIAKLTPGLISSANLICLEISSSNKIASYDFLHFFPFVRKLVVCENDVQNLNQMCFLKCVPEYRSCVKKNAWNVQRNIWEMLPLLHRVEASVKWQEGSAEKLKRKIFIRKG